MKSKEPRIRLCGTPYLTSIEIEGKLQNYLDLNTVNIEIIDGVILLIPNPIRKI